MSLKVQTGAQQSDGQTRNVGEHALVRCALAKKFEEAGDYESARAALGDLWRGVGERPRVETLTDARAVGEVLVRAGALTGWIGSAGQIEGAQEAAKDLRRRLDRLRRLPRAQRLPDDAARLLQPVRREAQRLQLLAE